MKKYIIILIAAFTLFSCTGKSDANNLTGDDTTNGIEKIYALKDYQQDFKQMLEILLKNHPQPYTLMSKDSLKSLI